MTKMVPNTGCDVAMHIIDFTQPNNFHHLILLQGCEQLVCLQDLRDVLASDKLLEREFLERSLRSFLDRSALFANCPVPDCAGIMPKIPRTAATAQTPEARLIHHCDVCHTAVCKR